MENKLIQFIKGMWEKTLVPTISNWHKKNKENSDSIIQAIEDKEDISINNPEDIVNPLLEAQNATTQAIKDIPVQVFPEVSFESLEEKIETLQKTLEDKKLEVNIGETKLEFEPVIKAIQQIKLEIPEMEKQEVIDYTLMFDELMKIMERPQDHSHMIEMKEIMKRCARTEDIAVLADYIQVLIDKHIPEFPDFPRDEDGIPYFTPTKVVGGGGGMGFTKIETDALVSLEGKVATEETLLSIDSKDFSTSTKQDTQITLETSIKNNQTNGEQTTMLNDDYGNDIEGTMLNQLKVAQTKRLSGGIFNNGSLDTNYFTAVTSNGGTAVVQNGEIILTLTTTADSYAGVRTNTLARYMGANMNYYRSTHRLGDTGAVNNIRRCGCCDTLPVANGAFFQLNGTTLQVVIRKSGEDEIISSGDFNGNGSLSGQSFTLDTNYHTFEIYYTSKKIMFVIDGLAIHTFTSEDTSLVYTRHFKAFMDSSNTGVGSAVSCSCMSLTINRYGASTSQPKTYFQQGLTAGVLLKLGVGSLHSMIISGVTNNSVVTIYDGTSTAGTVLWSTGAMTNQTVPFPISFGEQDPPQFENGLFLTVTVAACNVFIKYE